MSDAIEYELVGPVKARLATQHVKAQGFPEHHLTAKPGWYIVEFPEDAGRFNPIYSGYPLEIVLPPETFHENFKEVKKASTPKKDSK